MRKIFNLLEFKRNLIKSQGRKFIRCYSNGKISNFIKGHEYPEERMGKDTS